MSSNKRKQLKVEDIPRSDLQLDMELPVHIASYDYARKEFTHARKFEAGIIQGVDPEFLHQYRVCLRRTRAVVSLLKQLFPKTQRLLLSESLKQLMLKTGRQRDLDVYLLDTGKLYSCTGEKLHSGVTQFIEDLQSESDSESAQLNSWLTSDLYAYSCVEITDSLNALKKDLTGGMTGLNKEEYTCDTVWKQFSKVTESASVLTADCPDNDIHRLRKECKKLRYLLDFFRPVFDINLYNREIKALKFMQTLLGDYNDACVQSEFLLTYLKANGKTGDRHNAVERLREVSEKSKQQSRSEVLDRVKDFPCVESRLGFATLCKR